MTLPPDVKKRVDQWLGPPYDAKTQEAVQEMRSHDLPALIDAFETTIAFGTGGMRGIMGVGTNRLNSYTIGSASQGLANYLLSQESTPSVFISYDSRQNSLLFAQETAQVLAGNGIRVVLTKHLRPTPFVSFGCRFYQCTAAVMITASHNPPEYNGYKVYWKDGAQVVPPHDLGIIEEVKKITTPKEVKKSSLDDPLITYSGAEVEAAYFKAMLPLQNFPKENQSFGSDLHIIYSPLHGSGITTLPKGLDEWGFSSLSLVEAQASPDPTFPFAPSPNPEQMEPLALGMKQLLKEQGDLFLASDPDADRLRAVVRHKGEAIPLSGNQTAALCVYYLCSVLTDLGKMPEKGAFITTIVTTKLLKTIASAFNRPCFEVLTGFKYIGEKIEKWERDPNGHTFIFGAEESLGYLYGSQVRDKDATVAACLIAEMALIQKRKGETLIDLLHDIYRQFGLFHEKQLSISLEGGAAKIAEEKMAHFRTNLPEKIGSDPILKVADYLERKEKDCTTGEETPLTLPQSNVIALKLKSNAQYILRPSGTEPKIKLYGMTKKESFSSMEEGLKECDHFLETHLNWIRDRFF